MVSFVLWIYSEISAGYTSKRARACVCANGTHIYYYCVQYYSQYYTPSYNTLVFIAWSKTANCIQFSHICIAHVVHTHTHAHAYAQLFLNYSLVIKYFIYVLFVVIVDCIQLLPLSLSLSPSYIYILHLMNGKQKERIYIPAQTNNGNVVRNVYRYIFKTI